MSGAAPAWISYAALAVSAIAAIVAWLSYRATGPRIRLKVQGVQLATRPPRLLASVTVINKGRGAASILSFHVTPYGERKPVVDIAGDLVEGSSLPYRLEGHSQQTWRAEILPAAREYGDRLRAKEFKPYSSWPSHMFLTVRTGSGKFVHDKTHKFDAYSLVSQAHASNDD